MAANNLGVALELRGTKQDYVALGEALRNLGARRVLRTYWVLRSEMTASELRDSLKDYLYLEDRLFVTPVAGWASFRAMATPKDLNE